MNNHTDNTGPEKLKVHNIVGIMGEALKALVSKTISQTTWNISVPSGFAFKIFSEKISSFNMLILIIEKVAEMISDKKYRLVLADGIIIPANSSHTFKANEQFNMMSTIIEYSYEE